MAEIRRASCRGAAYQTDESAGPHGPHRFFPHQWAEAVACPGWAAMESDAAGLVDLMLRADYALPGIALECHPAVEYAMARMIIPGYREFTDPEWMSQNMPMQKLGGIPVIRTPAAGRGSWKLVSDGGVLAEGIVRDG